MSEENDFGFSIVGADEVADTTLSDRVAEAHRDRMRAVIAMITPLLDNLTRDPEKAYILWPDRVTKVTEFREKLVKLAFDPVTVE